jgi:hypothetical protein
LNGNYDYPFNQTPISFQRTRLTCKWNKWNVKNKFKYINKIFFIYKTTNPIQLNVLKKWDQTKSMKIT